MSICLYSKVPAHHCELKVSSLSPNERYVFAVAAYTSDGKLIGGGVGDTTKPILASHPLPVLMTWALISQVGIAHTLQRVEKHKNMMQYVLILKNRHKTKRHLNHWYIFCFS